MIDFPASPIVGQTFTTTGLIWTWDGTKWTANGLGTAYLPLAGGSLSGPLVLAADPTLALGAVTKQYVDASNKWTLIQTLPSASAASVAFTNIPQIYGDLMITGVSVTNGNAGAMSVSVDNGTTYSSFFVFGTSTANTTFMIVIHGYSNNIGFVKVNYNSAAAFAASPSSVGYTAGQPAVSTHTGGCNALKFTVNGGTSFTAASGLFSLYGR